MILINLPINCADTLGNKQSSVYYLMYQYNFEQLKVKDI